MAGLRRKFRGASAAKPGRPSVTSPEGLIFLSLALIVDAVNIVLGILDLFIVGLILSPIWNAVASATLGFWIGIKTGQGLGKTKRKRRLLLRLSKRIALPFIGNSIPIAKFFPFWLWSVWSTLDHGGGLKTRERAVGSKGNKIPVEISQPQPSSEQGTAETQETAPAFSPKTQEMVPAFSSEARGPEPQETSPAFSAGTEETTPVLSPEPQEATSALSSEALETAPAFSSEARGAVPAFSPKTEGTEGAGAKEEAEAKSEEPETEVQEDASKNQSTVPSTERSPRLQVTERPVDEAVTTRLRRPLEPPPAVFWGTAVAGGTGMPRVVYHGTPQEFGEFDPSKTKGDQSLYGPGTYFTEDHSVAREYAVPAGKQTTHTANIRPAYLNVRHAFNIDAKPDKKMFGAFVEELKRRGRHQESGLTGDIERGESIINPGRATERRTPTTNDSVYAYLDSSLGGKTQANDFLREQGFDAITHIGGKIVGKQPHQVWIMLARDKKNLSSKIKELAPISVGKEASPPPRKARPQEKLVPKDSLADITPSPKSPLKKSRITTTKKEKTSVSSSSEEGSTAEFLELTGLEFKIKGAISEWKDRATEGLKERSSHFDISQDDVEQIMNDISMGFTSQINEIKTGSEKIEELKSGARPILEKVKDAGLREKLEASVNALSERTMLDLLSRKLEGNISKDEKNLLNILSHVESESALGSHDPLLPEKIRMNILNTNSLNDYITTLQHEFTHLALQKVVPEAGARTTREIIGPGGTENENTKALRMYDSLLLAINESIAHRAAWFQGEERRPDIQAYRNKISPKLFREIFQQIDHMATDKTSEEFDRKAVEIYKTFAEKDKEDMTMSDVSSAMEEFIRETQNNS